MVVFLWMRVVMIPPAVSIPMLSGATSSRSRSDTFSDVSPLRMAACRHIKCQTWHRQKKAVSRKTKISQQIDMTKSQIASQQYTLCCVAKLLDTSWCLHRIKKPEATLQADYYLKLLAKCCQDKAKKYLDSCPICHSLIGVDGLAEVLAVEEVLQELLDLWDSSGASHKHNLVDC